MPTRRNHTTGRGNTARGIAKDISGISARTRRTCRRIHEAVVDAPTVSAFFQPGHGPPPEEIVGGAGPAMRPQREGNVAPKPGVGNEKGTCVFFRNCLVYFSLWRLLCKPSPIPFFLVLLFSMRENQSLSLGAISGKPSCSWMANWYKSVFPVTSSRGWPPRWRT